MNTRRGPTTGGAWLALLAVVWLGGCRSQVRVTPGPAPPAPPSLPPSSSAPTVLPRTGYAIQVGAFAVLNNARELARALNAEGLDAYYFPHQSGLYKVRFGDFPTKETAIREARRLVEAGVIEDYYVVGSGEYMVPGRPVQPAGLRDKLVATAESFLGVEYAWGGTSRREGFDCSGLVRAVYNLNGLSLPRSAGDQYRAGAAVPKERLRRGDLVFFSASSRGAISHVGIYVGGDTFIHAPGTGRSVRKDSLDGYYFKDHFSGARTYL